jgi:hypothetical protein
LGHRKRQTRKIDARRYGIKTIIVFKPLIKEIFLVPGAGLEIIVKFAQSIADKTAA